MKKLHLVIFALVALALGSCGKYSGYKETDNGLYYKMLKSGDSDKKPALGDLVVIEMVIKTDKDSVIFDSRKEQRPLFNKLTSPTYKGDIVEAFSLMAMKDSMSFIVCSDSLVKYNQFTFPASVKPGTMIYFDIRLDSIITKEAWEKERKALQKKQEKMVKEGGAAEQDTLNAYIKDNKITAKPTQSGLYYIEVKKGTGAQPKAGQTVKVNYAGFLLDGRMFDTNDAAKAKKYNIYKSNRPYEAFTFVVGQGQVIPGWDEALQMMKVGGKAKLIIPSNIAYGPNGRGDMIKPFSTLVFEVELLGVE